MNTKIVYVLTSTDKDLYLEQTLVSVISLRLHNPEAMVELVVDHDTAASLIGARAEIKKYITHLIEVETPSGFNNMKKSRYLKTNLRSIVDGDFLFVDGDTVVARPLNDIDLVEGDLCAVADKHVPIGLHQSNEYVLKQFQRIGVSLAPDEYYINSGVMLVRDTPMAKELYAEWYAKWLKNTEVGINTDQPPLAYADAKCGHPIKLMDGTWNCQVNENGVRYLHDAYIIHYFASNVGQDSKGPYLLMHRDLYDELKRTGIITSQLREIIYHPWSAFTEVCPIINEDNAHFIHTQSRRLYAANKKHFQIIEKFIRAYFNFFTSTYKIRHPFKKSL